MALSGQAKPLGRWGLAVSWSPAPGYVRFTDPFTGERVEVHTRHLRSERKTTDLRWMVRRAMQERAQEQRG